MKSKIAVIMPVYNAERFLKDSLDSVINQTFREISIICIDDLSTDNSLNILEEYSKKDNRIILLKNTTNKGAGVTRNIGLDYVYKNLPSIEYITFVDADDKIDTNTFEMAYNEAKKYGVDILNYNFIANTYWNYDTKAIGDVIEYNNHCLNAIFDRENFYTFIVCWSKLYKKELLKDIRFGNHRFFEDGAFAYKVLSRAKKLRAIPDILYIYNIENPESTCGKINEEDRILNIFDIIKETLEDWDKLNIKDKFENKFINHIILYISLVCPNVLETKDYSKIMLSAFGKDLSKEENLTLLSENTKNIINKMCKKS